jgi:hypothetical protein
MELIEYWIVETTIPGADSKIVETTYNNGSRRYSSDCNTWSRLHGCEYHASIPGVATIIAGVDTRIVRTVIPGVDSRIVEFSTAIPGFTRA